MPTDITPQPGGTLRVTPRMREASAAWAREDAERERVPAAFEPLTAAQAEALRRREPAMSPWWVVVAQVAGGGGVALLLGVLSGHPSWGWSMGWGVACVAVPAALMARGMTSSLTRRSPGASAVGFMAWEMVKIAVSVVMLAMAGRVVQPLSWLALIGGLVLGMKVYWLALLVRRRPVDR